MQAISIECPKWNSNFELTLRAKLTWCCTSLCWTQWSWSASLASGHECMLQILCWLSRSPCGKQGPPSVEWLEHRWRQVMPPSQLREHDDQADHIFLSWNRVKENEKCFIELIQSSGMRKFKSHEKYPTRPGWNHICSNSYVPTIFMYENSQSV